MRRYAYLYIFKQKSYIDHAGKRMDILISGFFEYEDYENDDVYIILWDVTLLCDIKHLKKGQKVDTVYINGEDITFYIKRDDDDDEGKVPNTPPDLISTFKITIE